MESTYGDTTELFQVRFASRGLGRGEAASPIVAAEDRPLLPPVSRVLTRFTRMAIMTAMAETNAIKWLRAQEADFEVLEYAFNEVGAEKAAEAVGKPLEMACKTLIVKISGRSFQVAIVPGDQRFDTRKMAAFVGEKQADLADQADAEKVSGYRIGGISPFAMRRFLPTVIEESLLALDRIIVNGGRRGVLIEMDTEDVVRLLDAQPADICG